MNPSHRSPRRAFNLLEVAVASVLVGIVAVAAISSFAVLNRQLVRLQAETRASDNAKTLIDFFVGDLQAVGGDAVKPWMSLWVEDGDDVSDTRCAQFTGCGASDRLTMALVVPDSQTCPVLSMTDDVIFTTGSGDSCCFEQLRAQGGGYLDPPSSTNFFIHTIVVRGGASRQVSLSNLVTSPPAPLTCSMSWKPGPLAGIDNVDGDDFYDANPADVDAAAVLPAAFNSGTIAAVTIRTLYLDETTHELFSFSERRGFNGAAVAIDANERTRIASNIFDFQVQLGYDGAPADGRLLDVSSATDEWLFNTPSGTADTRPATVGLADLRMVAVGIITGVNVRDANYASGAQIVGGSPKSAASIHMRGGMGKAALRNVFVSF